MCVVWSVVYSLWNCLCTCSRSNERPIALKFGNTNARDYFWEHSERIFFKKWSAFLKMIFKINLEFLCNLFFCFTILCIYPWYSTPISPKFGIKILKRDFSEDLEVIFWKIVLSSLQGCITILTIYLDYKSRKNWSCQEVWVCFCSK